MTSSLALDNWEQKYCQTTGNTAKPFTPCPARTIIFQRKNLNYLIVCFPRCTLFFPKSLFCIADLFAMRYLWVVYNEDECCVVTQRAAFASLGLFTFARIACLLQLWIKTSELDYSIGRRPNNNPFMDFSTEAKYSQLSPCGHFAITDNPRIQTAGKSQAKIN